MEFQLQYNAVVLNNKNFFYFENYCNDDQEFKEWLKYNHNTISIADIDRLDEHKQDIVYSIKEKYLVDIFLKYREDVVNDIPSQYANDYATCRKKRGYALKKMYEFFIDNEIYIDILRDRNIFLNNIWSFVNKKEQDLIKCVNEFS